MSHISEVGQPFHLSTENVISGQLEDFANITKDFFDNLLKVYNQQSRPLNVDGINKISNDLADKGTELKKSLDTALEQMNVHKEIEKTKEEINRVEKNILQAHTQLKEAEKILSVAIFQAKRKLEAGKQATSASVSCEDLIKFAFRISSGNSVEAPQDWKPGDPRRPYPLDIEMRCGALGQISSKNSDEDFEADRKVEEKSTGLWQGSSLDTNVNMATNMAASSIIGSTKNGGVDANNDDVEFMSTSSDSSSSGEST